MSTVAKKIMMGSGAVAGPLEIEQSLILDDAGNAHLKRTPSSAGNRRTFTLSCWIKRSTEAVSSTIFAQDLYFMFESGSDERALKIGYYTGAGGHVIKLATTAVFRDMSAWYHIVLAIDTTQGTASNRVKIYVNGVQQTSFQSGQSTYPSQNLELPVNNTADVFYLGALNATAYSVGYLAETHFIDGAAKAASDFGETNEDTGQWIPKEYTGGSYGTNGFYLPFKIGDLYSADFDGTGDYLSQTSMTTVGSGDFTIEGWCNRRDTGNQGIFQYSNAPLNGKSGALGLGVYSNNFYLYYGTSGALSARQVYVTIPAVGVWWHFAYVRASGTITIYLNGVAATTQSSTVDFNDTTLVVGGYYSTDFLWNGLISNFRVVKGTAVYTGNFTPPTSALTSVSGTILLNCQNSNIQTSTTGSNMTAQGDAVASNTSPTDFNDTFSGDRSGQGNSLTAVNLANSDVVIDSPTNNFATWNPLVPSTNTFTEGNLKATMSGSSGAKIVSTIGATTGKYYMEFLWQNQSNWPVGLTSTNKREASLSGIADGSTSIGFWIGSSNTALYINTSVTSWSGSGTGWSNNDMVGLAVDGVNQTISIYKNGSSIGSYDYSGLGWKQTFFAAGNYVNNNTYLANFGQNPTHSGATSAGSATDGNGIGLFKNAPPSGFLALCTANLPDPAIPLPSAHFNTVLYTGNGGTQTISGVGFSPSLVWSKSRGDGEYNILTDQVRGNTHPVFSNSAEAQETRSDGITSFNSDGYALGNWTGNNKNGVAQVSWNWKANGAGSQNTDGTINSTATSANQASGFSIVTYTGNNQGATVGHGLGVAPDLVIVRANAISGSWHVYNGVTSSDSENYYLLLDTTAAIANSGTGTVPWNNTRATSTVFSIGGANASTNINNATYVAYCFASKPGFSKIGVYTGNGSATAGPFVNCGFKPAWVMVKKTNATNNWIMFDNKRDVDNVATQYLFANEAQAEAALNPAVDFVSNGFKIRTTSNAMNTNAGTYLYMAFAESPFKNATAR